MVAPRSKEQNLRFLERIFEFIRQSEVADQVRRETLKEKLIAFLLDAEIKKRDELGSPRPVELRQQVRQQQSKPNAEHSKQILAEFDKLFNALDINAAAEKFIKDNKLTKDEAAEFRKVIKQTASNASSNQQTLQVVRPRPTPQAVEAEQQAEVQKQNIVAGAMSQADNERLVRMQQLVTNFYTKLVSDTLGEALERYNRTSGNSHYQTRLPFDAVETQALLMTRLGLFSGNNSSRENTFRPQPDSSARDEADMLNSLYNS